MKYHYQQGIIEKNKKGHKKLWAGFFAAAGIMAYGGFIFANLALNGWPLEPIDKTAKLVKNTKPGDAGSYLFIPAINLASDFGDSLKRSGTPENSNVTVKGNQLAFHVTPGLLRSSSPFFNIDKLKEGDEVFLDNARTRYVYKITNSPSKNSKKLILQSSAQKLTAEVVGTIAWNSGRAELQPL